MTEKNTGKQYNDSFEKFLAFLAVATSPLWYPLYLIYTSIADFGD